MVFQDPHASLNPAMNLGTAVGRTRPSAHGPASSCRARLADQAQHLAFAQVERDAVDRLHRPAAAPGDARAERAVQGVVDLESRTSISVPVARSAATSEATAAITPLRDGQGLALERRVAARGDLVARAQPALRAAVAAEVDQGRPVGRADAHGVVAARVEAARPARVDEVRRRARDRVQRRRPTARSSSAAARASTGGAGLVVTSYARPFSATIRPAYMTATRSHASATIPRLWVISSSAVSKFARRSARMRRIWGLDEHVQGGCRLVGHDHRRPQHERQRDHDPLPHAARELVRVLAVARRRDAHAAQRLQRTAGGPPCGRCPARAS